MGRTPCCDKAKVKRGPWSPEEDSVLKNYIESHGTGGNWIALPQKAAIKTSFFMLTYLERVLLLHLFLYIFPISQKIPGLKRCGKSCRLRWLNYLRPDIKHGGFTREEDYMIWNLYNNIGSRWSVIASHLPGRTDNDIKNYWNTKLKKRMMADPATSSSNTTINQINQSPSPLPVVKNEVYTCDDFLKPLLTTSAPVEAGFSFGHYNSFPVDGLTDSPGYHINASEASSLVTVEDSSYSNWWTNGSGDANEFFLGFEADTQWNS